MHFQFFEGLFYLNVRMIAEMAQHTTLRYGRERQINTWLLGGMDIIKIVQMTKMSFRH